ncbi:MAG TPA: hypothetical protein VM802_05420 [Chitinophaga sp.]|uniref:HD domain-containing protein n=1 Tax=Chitinophaga sp. TaxID=1869181 RepID=UPI002BC6B1AC|nr:hypothetical protein [Chitinophaga sp.]HVI44283.1 hypothetical protein [Chitinophaga sp.]
MPEEIALATWLQLNRKYTSGEALINSTFEELSVAYGNAGRHYHTLAHIAQLLTLQQQYEAQITDNDSLTFAIFFHDIVYNAVKKDNEEKSAMAAQAYLSRIAYPAEKIGRVVDFINATHSHINASKEPDLDYFLDFDLQILGADPATYQLYTQQIRQEYSIYPDLLYNAGRRKVLQHFLEMPAIFRTAGCRNLYEQQARENIHAELNNL